MKKLFFILMLFSFSAFATREGNGGDVFDYASSGEGYKFFDVMEYGDSFEPKDLPEFAIIKAQLDGLSRIAPKTVEFINSIFNPSAMLWSFVEPNLKDVPPSGQSKLVITHDRVQAAISDTKKLTVQINKAVWNELSPVSRAFLLMHEALWFADRAEESFLHLNPNAFFPNFFNGFDSSLPNYEFRAYDLSSLDPHDVINLANISTTSADIRRQTGFLIGKNFNEMESSAIKSISKFICANSGEVNQRSFITLGTFPGKRAFLANGYNVRNINPMVLSNKTPLCTMLLIEAI